MSCTPTDPTRVALVEVGEDPTGLRDAARRDGVRVVVLAGLETFRLEPSAIRVLCGLVDDAPWISIAAVDGACGGAGLDLALACTMRVAGPAASFAVGHLARPGRVGTGRAHENVPARRYLGAAEAGAAGLVERIASGGAIDDAIELAGRLANGSRAAQIAIRRCVQAAERLALAEGLAFEATQVPELLRGQDAREGIAAFLAKRRPRFS